MRGANAAQPVTIVPRWYEEVGKKLVELGPADLPAPPPGPGAPAPSADRERHLELQARTFGAAAAGGNLRLDVSRVTQLVRFVCRARDLVADGCM